MKISYKPKNGKTIVQRQKLNVSFYAVYQKKKYKYLYENLMEDMCNFHLRFSFQISHENVIDFYPIYFYFCKML